MENKEESIGKDKVSRILTIYSKLINGAIVNKAEEATNFGVNERSIQRDIDDIRNYLEQEAFEHGVSNEVIYDREKKGYRLEQIYKIKLTNDEILAISKILLDSRAFIKDEMMDMVQRLIGCCVPEINRKLVQSLIANESFHYVEPRHGKQFFGNNNGNWQFRLLNPNGNFVKFLTVFFVCQYAFVYNFPTNCYLIV